MAIIWHPYNLASDFALWVVEHDAPANVMVRIYAEADTAYTNPIASSENLATDLNTPVKLLITGLTPDTEYLWRAEIDGVPDDTTKGRLHTFPSGSGTWSKVVGSCQGGSGAEYPGVAPNTSDAPTFDFIKAKKPNMIMHMGDLTYRDPNSTNPTDYAQMFKDAWAEPRFREACSNAALELTPEDHEIANNADASHPGWPAFREAYFNYFPIIGGLDNIPVADRPAYRSRVIGGVRMIQLDTRSGRTSSSGAEDANKRILDDAQWSALEASLAEATEPLIEIMVGSGFIGSASLTQDNWRAYATERTRLVDLLAQYGLTDKTILYHGDSHEVALDDGTNSNYGTDASGPGPKVCCFAPLDNFNSTKGGPYNLGHFQDSNQQYGHVRYAPADGGGIEATVSAYALAESGESETLLIEPVWAFADAAVPEDNPFLHLTNGVAYSDADYHYFRVTESGDLQLDDSITADLFLVGGGGGAIRAGGGGGYTRTELAVAIAAGTHSVTIGDGGLGAVAADTTASDGGTTSITINGVVYDALGGKGAHDTGSIREGGDGGSGGGASGGTNEVTGAGGFDGSNGEAGARGDGGIGQGTTTRAFSEPTGELYSGGGGGGNAGTTASPGGDGGGADGVNGQEPPISGDANTGGGGGGSGQSWIAGGDGGSGTLILRTERVAAADPVTDVTLTLAYSPGGIDATLAASITGTPKSGVQFQYLNGSTWETITTDNTEPYSWVVGVSGNNGDEFHYRAVVDGVTSNTATLTISGQDDIAPSDPGVTLTSAFERYVVVGDLLSSSMPSTLYHVWDDQERDFVFFCWDGVIGDATITDSQFELPSGWNAHDEVMGGKFQDNRDVLYTSVNGALLSTTHTRGKHRITNTVSLSNGRRYSRSVYVVVGNL